MLHSLSHLVRELLLAIATLSSYPAGQAGPEPELVLLSSPELQSLVCGRPCPVQGWYSPEGVVYIAAELDMERSLLARSILLHELVHHLQRNRHGRQARNCREWVEREYEARLIQSRWLAAEGWRGRSPHAPIPLAVCRSD